MKISGKRIGPGEIESALIEHPAVKEAAAIGAPDHVKGEVLICFVVLNKDVSPNEELKTDITNFTVTKYGATTRPREIYFVSSLPKTRSGKIVRGAIRKKYLGEEIIDVSSIENLESLKAIPEIIIK
jgi:acetyl-CoA synthetase